jgi:hypothetical protein
MTSSIDGLWTVHVNEEQAGGVAAFINGTVVGGDSGHMLNGAVDVQGRSVGAYFRVQSVASNIPNFLDGKSYVDFDLEGDVEGHGHRISAKVESSLATPSIGASIELRKKVDFVSSETLLKPREFRTHQVRAGNSHAMPAKFGGFWTIEVESARGIGSGVLLLGQGTAVGGNSNYTFIGTSQTDGDEITIRLLMANFVTGGPNLLGYFGNCELDITGSLQRGAEVCGTAAVVHLPNLKGHCRLKRKICL